jgi:hypothetical protein
MGQGKRSKGLKRNKSDSNFQSAQLGYRGEYGLSGRYKPDGQHQSPGRKSAQRKTSGA